MTENRRRSNARPNDGNVDADTSSDARLTTVLGRIGDQATAPTWAGVVDRYHRGPSRLARLSQTVRDRRVWATAMAAVVGLVLVGSALQLGANLFDGDSTEIDTVNTPEQTPTPTTDDGSTIDEPDPDAVDGSDLDEDTGAVAPGCYDTEPLFLSERELVGSGQADIDGDGAVDTISSVTDVDPTDATTYVVAELGNGRWVVNRADLGLEDLGLDLNPRFDPEWPLGLRLDEFFGAELLAYHRANNSTQVFVYHFDREDCAVVAAINNDDNAEPYFVVEAASASCQDWCNVGLICRPDGTLTATRSEPIDPNDGRGDHRWFRTTWTYEEGHLVEGDTETGVLPFDELASIGVTNSVVCGLDDVTELAQPDHRAEAEALAELLGAETAVATVGDTFEPQGQGYVVTDGAARRFDTDAYRVVGVAGDALRTAPYGDWFGGGPFLDFDGTVIDCPANPGFGAATAGSAANPRFVPAVPVRRADGGWAYLVEGDEFGDPLTIDGSSERWWEVPLWEVDCETGTRAKVPSVRGSIFPQAGTPGEVEIFMAIEHRGDESWYIYGGEGVMTIVDGSGNVVVAERELYTWQINTAGTVIAALEGDQLRGYDAATGDVLWQTDVGANLGPFSHLVDDHIVLADDISGTVAMVDINSGRVAVEPTTFDNVRLVFAR